MQCWGFIQQYASFSDRTVFRRYGWSCEEQCNVLASGGGRVLQQSRRCWTSSIDDGCRVFLFVRSIYVVLLFGTSAKSTTLSWLQYYLKAQFHFSKDQFAELMVIAGVAGTVSQVISTRGVNKFYWAIMGARAHTRPDLGRVWFFQSRARVNSIFELSSSRQIILIYSIWVRVLFQPSIAATCDADSDACLRRSKNALHRAVLQLYTRKNNFNNPLPARIFSFLVSRSLIRLAFACRWFSIAWRGHPG